MLPDFSFNRVPAEMNQWSTVWASISKPTGLTEMVLKTSTDARLERTQQMHKLLESLGSVGWNTFLSRARLRCLWLRRPRDSLDGLFSA